MKRLLTLAIFFAPLFLSHTMLAQDSLYKYSVTVSPALFTPVTVAIQGGLQLKLNNRWSLLGEVAIPTFHPHGNEYEEIHYWRIGLDVKYRLSKIKSSQGYLALQTNYLFRELTDKQSAVFHTRNEDLLYTDAVIHSPVLSTAFIIGLELPANRKNLFADVFLGMGIRYIFNRYQTASTAPAFIDRPKDFFGFGTEEAWRFDYTLLRFHFTTGVRIGLRLKRK